MLVANRSYSLEIIIQVTHAAQRSEPGQYLVLNGQKSYDITICSVLATIIYIFSLIATSAIHATEFNYVFMIVPGALNSHHIV